MARNAKIAANQEMISSVGTMAASLGGGLQGNTGENAGKLFV